MNFEAKQPYQHSTYYMKNLIRDTMWTQKQLLETIDHVTIENMEHFVGKFFCQGIFIESLYYGNILRRDAIALQERLVAKLKSSRHVLPLQPSMNVNYRHIQLRDGSNHLYTVENKVHETKSLELFLQTGLQSSRANALAELYNEMVKEKFFDTLRTKEQLGYIVHSWVRSLAGVNGLSFIIQSDKSPDYLDDRIETFLKSVNVKLSPPKKKNSFQ